MAAENNHPKKSFAPFHFETSDEEFMEAAENSGNTDGRPQGENRLGGEIKMKTLKAVGRIHAE
ncbi:MAG: hypothetical protein JW929_09930 [Anaerolineales bacterium]|nr:hypothetical protein [Anaerolineales bacterium]